MDEDQAAIDADMEQLRAQLVSVFNPPIAHRLRGIANLAGVTPAAVLNQLLTEAGPILDVALAALLFTDEPNQKYVRLLTEAVEQLRSQLGGQRRAEQALRKLGGKS